MGRVVGAITGKKQGENIVDITTTIDLLQVFWEAEKARKEQAGDVPTLPSMLTILKLGVISTPLLLVLSLRKHMVYRQMRRSLLFVQLLVLTLRELHHAVRISPTTSIIPPPLPCPLSFIPLPLAARSGAPRLLRQEPSVALLHDERRDEARQA